MSREATMERSDNLAPHLSHMREDTFIDICRGILRDFGILRYRPPSPVVWHLPTRTIPRTRWRARATKARTSTSGRPYRSSNRASSSLRSDGAAASPRFGHAPARGRVWRTGACPIGPSNHAISRLAQQWCLTREAGIARHLH